MVEGEWFFTPHAVARYMERVHCPSWDDAYRALIQESRKAHYVKTKPNGVELWRGGRPLRMRYLVAKTGQGRLPVLLTVLRGHDAC